MGEIESTASATLRVGGSEVSLPATTEEIGRAIDAQPRETIWELFVGLPNDDSMSVAAGDGSSFSLVFDDLPGTGTQVASVAGRETLMAILASFLQSDGRWRSFAAWDAPGEAPPMKPWYLDGPIVGGWGALGVVIVLDIVMLGLGKGAWVGALLLLAVPILLVAAIMTKLREVRRAAKWTKGSARILRAEFVEATHNGRSVKLPQVEYEFSVRFDKFRGQRISIGEIMPGSVQAETALTRYPIGTSVPVFYDPADPHTSVLERDVPPYFAAIWGFVAVVAVGCVAGAVMILR
jgi:hypothetical protein